MKRAVSLFACTLIIIVNSACNSTPGLKEPDLVECIIMPGEMVECYDYKKEETTVIPLSEIVGYSALSPKHFANAKNHHDSLHVKLNQCLEDGK